MTDVLEQLRSYWNTDADTYVHTHGLGSAAERAAWSAVLTRLLPPAPARVLDVGAGTGAVSLLLAELGYEVTALDLAPRMLEHLQTVAAERGLHVTTVVGPGHEPPGGPFDAVTERIALWVQPKPEAALAAWRKVAPVGRLVALEAMWGAREPLAVRRRAREAVRRVRRIPSGHHAPLDPDVRAALPFGWGVGPSEACSVVEAAGWGPPRLERLRDVEWARLLALPPAERLLGTIPWYAVVAG